MDFSAWLNSIAFDNTLAGVKARIAELNAFKAKDKAVAVAENLDNDSRFNNLAVRLRQANRPAFAPAGKLPTDIEKSFEALNKIETEVSGRCQKELAHQLELEGQFKRFLADTERLNAWIDAENKNYVSVQEKVVGEFEFCFFSLTLVSKSAITADAKANLYTWNLHEKDVKNAKVARLSDLSDAAAKLVSANYEKKDEVSSKIAASSAQFKALEDALAAKKVTLEGDLKREEGNDDAACSAFAELVGAYHEFANGVKKAMQV